MVKYYNAMHKYWTKLYVNRLNTYKDRTVLLEVPITNAELMPNFPYEKNQRFY